MKRRQLLKSLTLLPIASGITNLSLHAEPAPAEDLYKELGIRTFINAAGTLTYMTGSIMQDKVLKAINSSVGKFCMLDELQDKVGEQIAKMTHAEAATVTSGAYSAMTLGLAGVLTGLDMKKVGQLPNLEGMKSEVICQRAHKDAYTQAFLLTGCKIITVETREELEKAINEKTAMMHFLNIAVNGGKIKHEEWIEVGKKHNIPTSIDIAADVPPIENLWKFNDMGFDLVFLSGGKAVRAPQSTGYLMGRKHLIEAARLSAPPRAVTIGRGHKVNKEEILGAYVAIKNMIAMDHDKEWKKWEAGITLIENAVKSIDGITAKVTVNPLGNHTPSLRITWDDTKIKLTGHELRENLRNGNPSIEAGFSGLPIFKGQATPPKPGAKGGNSVSITVWMMQPGEEKVVARRLREEFLKLKAES
ncbi:MAG: selenocysteine synthase [Sphingobacteriales bacterium 17-39-43]|uniref:selenocysteine synthase n=1 Tax=Daejeonella sp. TaxID=2805397 RepID=UPI000BD96EEF|nr:selenocysteine synthase [Daejeonella sp.]OYY03905.1 MAG: selenocysteine synthase [Sphingobacteriia bacterium 35-40-5]OYZ31606.1 MAG: selenocysteine synthase [Sphingobacteriales bacterium 16-39-50]OZA25001.1 MAG: selenocysteine synthase [Sphingobacteriales bacterium 17-39-43]HQS50691.1 selenocysteine synthase [Daejeonella sp.]HQT23586.1 selenocysteine synthase [Daejeonella sp.]